MPRHKLTDTYMRGLTAPTDTKKLLVADTKVPRLFAQITKDGARSFVIRYSVKRRERLMTIGRFPTWPAAAAREQAKELLQKVDQGIDPLAQRVAEQEAPTVKKLAERYVTEHLPTKRPTSAAADAKTLEKIILPALGAMKVADVNSSDIAKLHRKITQRGSPVRANRVWALCSKLFALSVDWKMRANNPATGAVKLNSETPRKRYLTSEELARLSKALAEYPNQKAVDAIRLQLLTGARPGEVLGAHWGQFNLSAKTWTLPASSTKQEAEHIIYLSAPALVLLTEMQKTAQSKWLFPSRANASGHIEKISEHWEKISAVAAFDPPVRRHDLRHSFASILVSSGRSLELIGALLGHSKIATTQRYAHLFDTAQRAAVEDVGKIVTDSREMAELHEIRRRG